MFFNLSSMFPNGSVFTSAEHTSAPVIRSAVIHKVHKTLSLTFSSNKTASSAHFTIRGKCSNRTIIVSQSLTHCVHGQRATVVWSFGILYWLHVHKAHVHVHVCQSKPIKSKFDYLIYW